jgi:hypothetical protein
MVSLQIAEGMQVAPDVSLGRNRPSTSTMAEGDRSAKKARVEQPSGHVEPAGVGAVVDTSLLNCPLCSRPFKPPVFQVGVISSRCPFFLSNLRNVS